ncbi:hypothetical protein ACGE0T_01095 [Parabacteroides sp. APC149_11_2_Y6]
MKKQLNDLVLLENEKLDTNLLSMVKAGNAPGNCGCGEANSNKNKDKEGDCTCGSGNNNVSIIPSGTDLVFG